VLRAVFPDDNARHLVDKQMPPLSKSPLSGYAVAVGTRLSHLRRGIME
jgi:hypothetical protein